MANYYVLWIQKRLEATEIIYFSKQSVGAHFWLWVDIFKWNHFHLHEDRPVPQNQQVLLVGSLQRECAARVFPSAGAEQGQGSALLTAHKFSNTGIVFKIKTELKLQLAHFLKCKGHHSGSKHAPMVGILPNQLLLQTKEKSHQGIRNCA